MMPVIGLFVLAAALAGGFAYGFFGHYWHVLNGKDNNDE